MEARTGNMRSARLVQKTREGLATDLAGFRDNAIAEAGDLPLLVGSGSVAGPMESQLCDSRSLPIPNIILRQYTASMFKHT
ncbi:hypothetical protein Tco_0517781 [Tanacetum coccineum]